MAGRIEVSLDIPLKDTRGGDEGDAILSRRRQVAPLCRSGSTRSFQDTATKREREEGVSIWRAGDATLYLFSVLLIHALTPSLNLAVLAPSGSCRLMKRTYPRHDTLISSESVSLPSA